MTGRMQSVHCFDFNTELFNLTAGLAALLKEVFCLYGSKKKSVGTWAEQGETFENKQEKILKIK